jgi:transcriptional regulator with XRE-family HTH domain
MGIRLEDYRIENNIDQEVLAKNLGISVPTLARIEAAEREGRQYRMLKRNVPDFLKRLSVQLEREVTIDDLENVVIAPPRPGRPKKKMAA